MPCCSIAGLGFQKPLSYCWSLLAMASVSDLSEHTHSLGRSHLIRPGSIDGRSKTTRNILKINIQVRRRLLKPGCRCAQPSASCMIASQPGYSKHHHYCGAVGGVKCFSKPMIAIHPRARVTYDRSSRDPKGNPEPAGYKISPSRAVQSNTRQADRKRC